MSQEPYKLLTLVIPTYNMEKYLTKCLESVTAPCIPPTLEVIVVNDASTDNTMNTLRRYQKEYQFSIIAMDKNSGAGSCRNGGV